MKSFLLKTVVLCAIALPAAAQPVAPAVQGAPPVVDAQIAHHDRVVARRAYRHGNYRKAQAAAHAANNAAIDAHTPQ